MKKPNQHAALVGIRPPSPLGTRNPELRLPTAGVLLCLALVVLAATPLAAAQSPVYENYPSATPFGRTDTVDENYLVGYLAVASGKGEIRWTTPPQPTNGAPARNLAQDGRIGWPLRAHTGDDRGLIPVDEFVSDPLPTKVWLNVSRVIQVDLFLLCGGDFLELWAGTTFVAGVNYRQALRPYTAGAYRMHPEVESLEAGSRLQLRLLFKTSAPPECLYELGPGKSAIRLPLYSVEELVFRKPQGFQQSGSGQGSASGPEQGRGEGHGPWVAILPWLVAPFQLPPRSRNWKSSRILAVLSLISLPLAGCLGGPSNQEAAAGENQPQAGGTFSIAYVNSSRSGLSSSVLGDILGQVFDTQQVPVQGARAMLVEFQNSTETDWAGRFDYRDVPVGNYTLRIDKARFQRFEGPVRVLPGTITRVDVELSALELLGDDFRPHPHDYWKGLESATLFEEDVQLVPNYAGFLIPYGSTRYPGCSSAAIQAGRHDSFCGVYFQIPESEPGNFRLVLPGTRDIEVTVSWKENENRVFYAGIAFLGNGDPGYKSCPSCSLEPNWTLMYPRRSGEPTHVRTNWEMTDVGHQKFTTWRFFVHVPQMGGVSDAQLITGPFHVKITVHRGVVPLEPAHREFWGGANQLVLLDRAPYTQQNVAWIPGDLVPPETKRLEFLWRWKHPRDFFQETLGVSYNNYDKCRLLFKPANVRDQYDYYHSSVDYSKYQNPAPERSLEGDTGGEQRWLDRYNLTVTADQADHFYSKVSEWRIRFPPYLAFGVSPELITCDSASNLTMVAYRDPPGMAP